MGVNGVHVHRDGPLSDARLDFVSAPEAAADVLPAYFHGQLMPDFRFAWTEQLAQSHAPSPQMSLYPPFEKSAEKIQLPRRFAGHSEFSCSRLQLDIEIGEIGIFAETVNFWKGVIRWKTSSLISKKIVNAIWPN
jgi:hypothetical protein